METLLLLVRVVLALVLVVAAVGKVRDQRGTAASAAQLGVPAGASSLVAALLPVVEVACAVLLLVPQTARAGGVASFLLLGAFTAVLARTLASGRRPSCHCFGQLSDEPISTTTLVRNAVLLALAAAVVAGGGADEASVADVADDAPDAVIDIGALVAVALTVGGMVLADDQRTLRRRLDDLEATSTPAPGIAPGRPAPPFELRDLAGRTWSLAELHADKPVVLVFTDARCVPCTTIMPELADWSLAYEDAFRIAIVASGDRANNEAKAAEHGIEPVLVQPRDAVARAYRYAGTPGAVVVGTDGLIAEPLASGAQAVRGLVGRLTTKAGGVRLTVGMSAPPFHVHDDEGHHVDNAALSGTLSILLFWDEGCVQCQSLDRDLQQVLPDVARAGVTLLVASASGGTGWDAAPGVRTAHDRDRAIASAYGSPGTPSAVLIDAEGKIASPVVAGGDELLALIERAVRMGRLAGSFTVKPV